MPAGQLAGLRRLFWESHTLALADLKHRTEHGTDAVNKKLPTAERQARANEQRTRLVGVTWGPDSEPSHQLVDRFVAMCEENVISYVKPELCTSRAQEILSNKQSQSFSLSSDGNLRVKGHESDLECTVTGEMKLREAFRRRALAMDLAQMVTYTVSEEWHAFLFLSIQREPPKGFRPVNLGQIIAADKRLWVLVSEATRGNVVATGGAAKPCDAVVSATSTKPEVMNFLSPLPILPDKSETVHRSEPYNTTKGKGKGKSKDGKHQASHNDNYLPDGCVLKKPDGKPLCGLYNKGRCWQKNVKPNGLPSVLQGRLSSCQAVSRVHPHRLTFCGFAGSGFTIVTGLCKDRPCRCLHVDLLKGTLDVNNGCGSGRTKFGAIEAIYNS